MSISRDRLELAKRAIQLLDAGNGKHDAEADEPVAGESDEREWHLLADLAKDPKMTAKPVAIAPPIAYAGRLTLFVGREKKGGKSTTTCATVAAASKQGVMCFYLTIDEPPSDTVSRLLLFGADPERVAIATHRVADLSSAVRASGAQVLVVDTLAKFVAGKVTDPNNSLQWAAALLPLTLIAREDGVAVVINAHAKKSDGEYRDSTAIGAEVDTIITCTEQKDGSRKATSEGRFHVPAFTARMDGEGLIAFEYEGGERVATVPRMPPSDDMQRRVLQLLQSVEPEGLKSAAWQKLVASAGVAQSTVFYQCRRELFNKGHLTFQSGTYRLGITGTKWLESDA